jgi:hypothetical protein
VRAAAALAAILFPLALNAQDVTLHGGERSEASEAVRRVLASPHVVRGGSGPLVLTSDSAYSGGLLVLGRPTYLASSVHGDVVVVGADLFLRPGVAVQGRAVAIGGTVSGTTLGSVANGTLSLRDETYDLTREGDHYSLVHRELLAEDREPVISLAGLQGFLTPSYDRVDGLSLPVGIAIAPAGELIRLQLDGTYRSRLGTVDPGAKLTIAPSSRFRLEARGSRTTRTNDDWIYSNLVNSITTFFAGTDTRNYFRSTGVDARAIFTIDRTSYIIEPYVGFRAERVRSISATGDVWTMFGRDDSLRTKRPNPFVQEGDIQSALAGVEWQLPGEDVTGSGYLRAEQSFDPPAGSSDFFQFTFHGTVQFPTFGTQSLHVKVHAVTSSGDVVPAARYAYLGGSGTLATLDLLEQGGSELLYVENRYLIPIERFALPFVGTPILSIRDAFGSAGVNSLPSFQHEVGAGLGVSVVHFDFSTAVAGRKGSRASLGISLSM